MYYIVLSNIFDETKRIKNEEVNNLIFPIKTVSQALRQSSDK